MQQLRLQEKVLEFWKSSRLPELKNITNPQKNAEDFQTVLQIFVGEFIFLSKVKLEEEKDRWMVESNKLLQILNKDKTTFKNLQQENEQYKTREKSFHAFLVQAHENEKLFQQMKNVNQHHYNTLINHFKTQINHLKKENQENQMKFFELAALQFDQLQPEMDQANDLIQIKEEQQKYFFCITELSKVIGKEDLQPQELDKQKIKILIETIEQKINRVINAAQNYLKAINQLEQQNETQNYQNLKKEIKQNTNFLNKLKSKFLLLWRLQEKNENDKIELEEKILALEKNLQENNLKLQEFQKEKLVEIEMIQKENTELKNLSQQLQHSNFIRQKRNQFWNEIKTKFFDYNQRFIQAIIKDQIACLNQIESDSDLKQFQILKHEIENEIMLTIPETLQEFQQYIKKILDNQILSNQKIQYNDFLSILGTLIESQELFT